MREVKLFVASSLDGYLARPDGDVGWLFQDGDYGMRAFFKSVDVALMGRKTHDWMIARRFEHDPRLRTIVFSRDATPRPGVEVVSRDPRGFVAKLRREPGKHLWLVGGGELVASFLNAELVDEIIVSIHPLVLGRGLQLFPEGVKEIRLRLTKTQSWPTGLVQLTYRVLKSAPTTPPVRVRTVRPRRSRPKA